MMQAVRVSVNSAWKGVYCTLLTIVNKRSVDRTKLCGLCSQACSQASNSVPHEPVMVQEVIEYLKPSQGKIYVDMTFGSGGHSTRLLEQAPDIKIYALDRDPTAHEFALTLSDKYPGQVVPLLGKFSDLPKLLVEHKVPKNSIDGFLFDFGCSSMQFDNGERGFSISNDGPLDMRMDASRNPLQPTAADVLQDIDEVDLVRVLKVYGEEKKAKKIARAIIEAKYMFRSLRTTRELADLIHSVLDGEKRLDKLGRSTHSATKTFQALRIFVNNELNEINYAMILAGHYLKRNGRLVAISFHGLEDTIVKRHLTGNVDDNLANMQPLKFMDTISSFGENHEHIAQYSPWKMLHKHVLSPSVEEVNRNPRARSAKFRAIERIK